MCANPVYKWAAEWAPKPPEKSNATELYKSSVVNTVLEQKSDWYLNGTLTFTRSINKGMIDDDPGLQSSFIATLLALENIKFRFRNSNSYKKTTVLKRI